MPTILDRLLSGAGDVMRSASQLAWHAAGRPVAVDANPIARGVCATCGADAAGGVEIGVYMRLGPGARNGLVGRSGEEFGCSETLKFFFPDVWRWAKAAGVYQ
jgi:hypothetical protein